MLLHILAVGDVVGEGGQDILSRRLREIQEREDIHFTVVNGENASGVGITPPAGPGHPGGRGRRDHPGQPHLEPHPDRGLPGRATRHILRPANYAGRVPGRGFGVFRGPAGAAHRRAEPDGPAGAELQPGQPLPGGGPAAPRRQACDVVLVDFHAEATSEKGAMGWYLDGRAQAVWGTHTHVPTADCQLLPKGTGFVTDLGMTGPCRSVLGIRPEHSINLFLGGLPRRYEEAEGPCKLEACRFTIDTEKKRCVEVRRADLWE